MNWDKGDKKKSYKDQDNKANQNNKLKMKFQNGKSWKKLSLIRRNNLNKESYWQ